MNRGELKTTIRSYTHGDDGDTLLNTWIDWTTARIGRELRAPSNCKRADFVPTARISDLPADFCAMELFLRAGENGGTIKLQAGSGFTRALPNEGSAGFYNLVSGNQIEIYPYVAGTYEIVYYFKPAALTTDSSTNGVATDWPQLYVYGAMIEAAALEQDGSLHQGAIDVFSGEINRINAAHQRSIEGMQIEGG